MSDKSRQVTIDNIELKERNKSMLKVLFVVLVLVLGAWVIRQQLPDIQRYLNIRSM